MLLIQDDEPRVKKKKDYLSTYLSTCSQSPDGEWMNDLNREEINY